MIEARHFVEAARERGFEWYAGVPCSYLTPFINYVLQEPSLHYVSMANEGDAVALIAGVALAGDSGRRPRRGIAMMQNSGLGNAVSPLTSLTWTFRLPQLLIVTWRGQPGVPDEPQHALMGPITPTMLDTMEIRWELFPTDAAAIGPALDRAVAHMDATGRPYALVMQKGSVANYPLKPGADAIRVRSSRASAIVQSGQVTPAARVSRQEALREVVKRTGSAAVLASTGFCGRELYAVEDRAESPVHGRVDGLRRAAGAGAGVGSTGSACGRARRRWGGADADGCFRDRRCLRAAEPLAPVARQWRP